MFVKAIIAGSHLPVVVSVIYALIGYRHFNRPLQVFTCFLFVSGLIQLLSLVLWFANINNLPLLHLYVPLGFVLLSWFYSVVLKGFISPRVLRLTALLFVLFSLINSLWLQPWLTYNSNALVVGSVLIIIYSLSAFIFLLNTIFREQRSDYVNGLNWINSGLFIYYASSLVVFWFGQLLTVRYATTAIRYTWAVHAFVSAWMYVFFIIGLWKRSRI